MSTLPEFGELGLPSTVVSVNNREGRHVGEIIHGELGRGYIWDFYSFIQTESNACVPRGFYGLLPPAHVFYG